MKDKLRKCVKACGGAITHWVNIETGKSLCGDAPKNRPSAKMKPRGKWLAWKDQAYALNLCKTCVNKYEALP